MRINYAILFIVFAFLSSCGESGLKEQNSTKPESTEVKSAKENVLVPKPEYKGPSFEFKIIQMNDVYEIAPSRSRNLGGLARVASLRKQLLEENKDVITVLCGDFLSPSFIGLQKDEKGDPIAGRHMIEVLNAVGLDYATFGNHEFDLSYDQLSTCINMSDFKWTSCNVFHSIPIGVVYFEQERNGQKEDVGRYLMHKFQTEEFGEIKLGIMGVTLPFNIKDYVNYSTVFLALKSTYEEVYPLSDLRVLMTHLNKSSDLELARRLPVFPLIMGGHDHENMKEQVGNTVITKADANANSVYVHTLNYFPETKAVKVESELVIIDSTIPEDPEVKQVVDKWQAFSDKQSAKSNYKPYEVITQFDTAVDVREVNVRNKAADIGWLIGQSYLWAFPEADCAILNGGSIRLDDYLGGDVKQQDILAMLPFGGPVSIVKIKGEELQKVLDIGVFMNLGKGGFIQVSNIAKGGKFWFVDGDQLKYEKEYTVLMPKYLADGKELNLERIKDYSSKTPAKTANGEVNNDVRDIMIQYLKSRED